MLVGESVFHILWTRQYSDQYKQKKQSMSGINGPSIKIGSPVPAKSSSAIELKKLLTFGKDSLKSSGADNSISGPLQFKTAQKSAISSSDVTPSSIYGASTKKQRGDDIIIASKISQIPENSAEESMLRESQKQQTLQVNHDKELIITNLSSIAVENSLDNIDLQDIGHLRGTNALTDGRSGREAANLNANHEKKREYLDESIHTPTFSDKSKRSPPTFNPKLSGFNSNLSSLTNPKDEHKIRLRDYLFMVNTSVEAAAKKRRRDLQQNKTLYIQQPSVQEISRCQSDASIGISNRYHSEKYKINNHQIGTLLKKEAKDEIGSLRERLNQLERLVDKTCDHLEEKDISSMLELKRFLQTSNQRGGQLLQQMQKMSPPASVPFDFSKESVVLVRVPGQDHPILQQPPLIGTFHKQMN